jgi:hypothetical protein
VGAEGDSLGVAGDAETEEEDDDGEDMGHVSTEAEDVHAHYFDGVVGDRADVSRVLSNRMGGAGL